MADIPERPCTVVPLDTSCYGNALVPVEKVRKTITGIYAEYKTDGILSASSQLQLNTVCFSARHAGTLDTLAFEEGLASANGKINVDCSTCPHRKTSSSS